MTNEQHRGDRTLVVEDDPILRSLIMRVLQAHGVAVDAAADGEEAMTLLERSDYAVILLDLMLPRVSGVELLQWLGARAVRSRAVIIVLSAAIETHFDQLDCALVHGVMRKPFDVDLLAGTVAAIVDHPEERSLPADDAARRHSTTQ